MGRTSYEKGQTEENITNFENLKPLYFYAR
jgi:hypothetical protein